MMSNEKYVPQVGDRVRWDWWGPDESLHVDFVGQERIFGTFNDGSEGSYSLDCRWIKVETPTPLPDGCINVYASASGLWFSNRRQAESYSRHGRIAVVHIWTDSDGVDHAEIERVAE